MPLKRERWLYLALAVAVGAFVLSRTKVGGSMIQSALDKAAKLITGEEGERLTVYKDTGGAWTIGRGHLVKAGEPYYPYGTIRTITKEQSDALFSHDMQEAQNAVALVKVPLNANERAALLSLAFNIGITQFRGSTLLKVLNAGDRIAAADQFAKWRMDNNVVVPGLVARRAREAALFRTAV